ncbi:hypothetical protein ACFLQW_02475 [Candidatus Zixiibacteriota bacterium]
MMNRNRGITGVVFLIMVLVAITPARSGDVETGNDSCFISGMWYSAGEIHSTGCVECDPSSSQTSWTPILGCYKIVLAALNEAYDGKIGGIEKADCLCADQATAAGLPGIWKAFLSSSSRDAGDLIVSDTLGVPVVNLYGTFLYSSWNDMLYVSSGFPSEARFYTFNLTPLDEDFGEWHDADAWHGSYPDGTVKPDHICDDWTSNLEADMGANGEMDMGIWLGNESTPCDNRLAVVCVQVAPYCDCPRLGDCNNNGVVDLTDVIYLIDYAFRDGPAPRIDPYCPVINRGDLNCDDKINLIDVVVMINYVFHQSALGLCDPCSFSS